MNSDTIGFINTLNKDSLFIQQTNPLIKKYSNRNFTEYSKLILGYFIHSLDSNFIVGGDEVYNEEFPLELGPIAFKKNFTEENSLYTDFFDYIYNCYNDDVYKLQNKNFNEDETEYVFSQLKEKYNLVAESLFETAMFYQKDFLKYKELNENMLIDKVTDKINSDSFWQEIYNEIHNNFKSTFYKNFDEFDDRKTLPFFIEFVDSLLKNNFYKFFVIFYNVPYLIDECPEFFTIFHDIYESNLLDENHKNFNHDLVKKIFSLSYLTDVGDINDTFNDLLKKEISKSNSYQLFDNDSCIIKKYNLTSFEDKESYEYKFAFDMHKYCIIKSLLYIKFKLQNIMFRLYKQRFFEVQMLKK